MDSNELNLIMFVVWSIGIMGINVYLSHVLDVVHTSTKEYFVHFSADILISATAGVITYLLAKTVSMPDIYLVMVAAVIGHLSARVAYKSILVDMLPSLHEDMEHQKNLNTIINSELLEPEPPITVKPVEKPSVVKGA